MPPEALAKLLAAPALPAPKGVSPDFENPPNNNRLAWVVTTVCMVVATSCVCLRLFARVWVDKRIRAEEAMMICAYGAYWGTAYAGYSLIFTPGYFVHTWNLRNEDLIRPLYLILVYGCCYSAVLPLIKTAILMDWCRVFVPINKTRNLFWITCWAVIFLQCLWGILCIILLNMQCRPHEAIWRFYIPSKCYSSTDVMLTSATVQVISDVIMFILPQRIIWNLQMSWPKKIGISIIFGVGILASIAAILRLIHTVAFARNSDSMYLIGPLLFWACAEMTCGFFIYSVPCLSKMIMGTGFARRITAAFGFSQKPGSSSNSTPNSTPCYGSRAISLATESQPWLVANTDYSQIQGHNIPLTDTLAVKSESQTYLNDGPSQSLHSHDYQSDAPTDTSKLHASVTNESFLG